MTAPLVLRCSKLPIAFLCPGSVRPDELLIDEVNDEATLGTAAHDGLATLVETGEVNWPEVPELATRYGVSESGLRLLLGNGAKIWAEVHERFPNARTEVELAYHADDFVLTGHADILGRSGGVDLLGRRSANTAHVGDWKGGRLDTAYREQLLGYCALAMLADVTLESATAEVLWLRELEWEHHSLTCAQLPAWLERLRSEVVQWDGIYRPGKHCPHCVRSATCPAANALARRDVAAIANLDADVAAQLETLAPEEKIDLLEMADHVAKIAKSVRATMRTHVLEHGDVSDGKRRLTVVQDEERKLDVLAAFPILEDAGFGDDDWVRVLTISIAESERIVAKRAGRGKGAKAVRELRAQLAEASAIETVTTPKLVTRRA